MEWVHIWKTLLMLHHGRSCVEQVQIWAHAIPTRRHELCDCKHGSASCSVFTSNEISCNYLGNRSRVHSETNQMNCLIEIAKYIKSSAHVFHARKRNVINYLHLYWQTIATTNSFEYKIIVTERRTKK